MYRVVILLLLFLVSCDKNFDTPKPDVVIPAQVMEDIMYDIKILKAVKNKRYKIYSDNNIQVAPYIYEKYAIDSTLLRENIAYYSTLTFEKRMLSANNINDRIQLKMGLLEKEIKVNDSIRKRNDSLKNPQEKYKSSVSPPDFLIKKRLQKKRRKFSNAQ